MVTAEKDSNGGRSSVAWMIFAGTPWSFAHLRSLTSVEWQRGGTHPRRGRMTVADFVTEMAWHDDNHREQLRRALGGTA